MKAPLRKILLATYSVYLCSQVKTSVHSYEAINVPQSHTCMLLKRSLICDSQLRVTRLDTVYTENKCCHYYLRPRECPAAGTPLWEATPWARSGRTLRPLGTIWWNRVLHVPSRNRRLTLPCLQSGQLQGHLAEHHVNSGPSLLKTQVSRSIDLSVSGLWEWFVTEQRGGSTGALVGFYRCGYSVQYVSANLITCRRCHFGSLFLLWKENESMWWRWVSVK
jgi:hypothetical protein